MLHKPFFRRALPLVLALVLIMLGIVPSVQAANDKIIINEFYRAGSFTTDEWLELLIVQDLTKSELESFFFGDSNNSTSGKVGVWQFTGMPDVTYQAGTLIAVGGGVSTDTSYNPAGDDWNIALAADSANLNSLGLTMDFAGNDVIWVDTVQDGLTISADGFALTWDSVPGAFAANALVTISAPDNNTGAYLNSDLAGATTPADWTTSVAAASLTPGQPNGGDNSTYIDSLRGGGGGDPTPSVKINEIRIDQPSGDNDEYFELKGTANASLNGLSYLVIGDGTGGSGVIEAVVDLSSQTIPADGFFVAAENTFTLGAGIVDFETTLNFEKDDNVTHLLVQGFSGALNDDLDTDNNGTLDVTPWTTELDRIALVKEANPPTNNEYHYGPPSIGPNGEFVPGHAYVCADTSEWGIGGFDLGTDDTPGAANANCEVLVSECGQPATLISTIQGTTDESPEEDNTHTIEGVVVGVFPGLDGYFIQEEDSDADANPLTSEGLFIYDPSSTISANVGDVVRVTGQVDEFFNLTELKNLSKPENCGVGTMPTAASITLPLASDDFLERYEGMAVSISQTLYVTETFNLGRFGEVGLATQRLFNPTERVEPGSQNYSDLDTANDLNRILLDDGLTTQNPDPTPYLYPNPQTLRLGDTVSGLTGVMSYGFDFYRIQPTSSPAFVNTAVRPTVPAVSANTDLRVASFNVLNYFTTLDSRGADTSSELIRQTDKIVAAMNAIDADIYGLMEIENNADEVDAAITALVDALNTELGANTYSYINTGVVGTDEIAVALIYKTASVTPVGNFATKTDGTFATSSRPPVAQTFTAADGDEITVVVNHFKSKGSCPSDGSSNEDQGDGQGCWNALRTQSAQELAAWLGTNPTGASSDSVLIIGDLNAYTQEDPIVELEKTYTNLVETKVDEANRYSYVFFGEAGVLDHALASSSLVPKVEAVNIWHINSDEPRTLDYDQDFNNAALYVADQWRSSDHDPVIVDFDFDETNDAPVLTAIGNKTVQVNTELAFTAEATDADGDTLTFSLEDGDSGTVPTGAVITAGGDFTWTPDTTGQFTFDVVVTDDAATPASDRETITVTVTQDPDAAPTGPFNLLSPADGITLRSTADLNSFSWEDAADATNYTFTLLHISNNVRLGEIINETVDAVCAEGLCTYAPDAAIVDALADGLYAWSVLGNGVTEASNAAFTFILDTQDRELLVNTSFETDANADKQPDGWTARALSADKLKCNKTDRPNGKPDKIFANSGDCAYLFKGRPGENARLIQKPDGSFLAADDVLSFSLYADTTLAAAGRVGIVKVKYADGSKSVMDIRLEAPTQDATPDEKPNYQQFSADELTLTGTPTKVVVQIRSRHTSGKLFIDDVSLVAKAAAPQMRALPDDMIDLPPVPGDFRDER